MKTRLSPLFMVLAAIFWGGAPAGLARAQADTRTKTSDVDGDLLPDFQEVLKYNTDPQKQDTGKNGISDGDPNQRREFTYSRVPRSVTIVGNRTTIAG